MSARRLALAATAILLGAPLARAQETTPAWDSASLAEPLSLELPSLAAALLPLASPQGEGDDEVEQEDERLTDWFIRPDDSRSRAIPRFRVELSLRGAWMVDGRVKKGRARDASTIDLQKDAHLPVVLSPGARFVFDVKFHPHLVAGVHSTALFFDGPTRPMRKRKTFQSVSFEGGVPTETLVDVQLTEFFLRYVIRDNPHIRFAVGIGAAWAQMRVRLRSEQARARGRVNAFLAPTIGYHVTVQVHPRCSLFLESVTAVIAPLRFPSYVSEFRLGLRIPLVAGVEGILAVSMLSGWLEDLHDLTGPKPTDGHKMRAANWTILSGDIGLAWRF